jgi:hypothetical protein
MSGFNATTQREHVMGLMKSRPVKNVRARLAAAIESLENRTLLTAVVVNTTADSIDPPSNSVVSLRDAIHIANASTTATTITFSPAIFGTAKTITLGGSDLEVTAAKAVTITGPAAGVTVNANHGSNEFQIDLGATVTMSHMTLTGGDNNFDGGAIENHGTITLTNMLISGNHAGGDFGAGGGINSNGTATLVDCTITGNTADFYGAGGGIKNFGTMKLTDCTVSGNASGASNTGGGISSDGPITLTGCTISGNTGGVNGGGGGGIQLGSNATVTNCTISDNTDTTGRGGGIELYTHDNDVVTIRDSTISGNTSGAGGGIDNYILPNPHGGANYYGGTCNIANTVIAGNSSAVDPDAAGIFASAGFNLVGKVGGSTGWKSTDLTGTIAAPLNAALSPLANHGGPTLTMLPLVGSPLINHGSNALIPAGITSDQRGFPRIVNSKVDIGAVEVRNTSIISASVFRDDNGSGKRDPGEEGLGGWKVYLDLNNNGKPDAGEPSTTTTSTGYYALSGLAPGNYVVRIVAKAGYKQTAPAAATAFTVGSEQTVIGPAFGEVPIGPFGGSPASFGKIQAENFDLGGQNTGYFNPTNTNRGGLYRPLEGIGIGAIPAADGGGFFVGYTTPGEYLNYTVSVAATGAYTLNFRVASQPKGGTFHLNLDGKDVTDELSIPSTGSYDTYKTISDAGITMTSGTHVLQLVIDSSGTGTSAAGNFDWIQAVKTGPPNLLANGNFAQGTVGFSSQYPNSGTAGGGYLVGSNPSAVFDGSWLPIGDHTTGSGLMLLADASTTANKAVWQETVNVATGTNYSFAGWAADMHALDTNVPDLAVYINNVKVGSTFAVPSNPGGVWSSFGASWNSGANKTATIKIVDLDTDFIGNDFALDDLTFGI